MRDLSIHITESSLRLIMSEYDTTEKEREAIIEHLLSKAKKYSCTHRLITISTEQQKKEVNRIVKSSIGDTKLMANTILFSRRKLGHRGIKQITEGSKDWLMCKDIAENAKVFCRDFGLAHKEGFAIYVGIILPKLKVFSINFMNAHHEYACSVYEATVELNKDPTPSKTRDLYNLFQRKAIDLSGMNVPYHNDPTKYVFFKRAKDFCESIKCPYDEYLQAQFDGLEFARVVPTPEQLVGPNASSRLQRYVIKEGGRRYIENKDRKKIDWRKVKKAEEL